MRIFQQAQRDMVISFGHLRRGMYMFFVLFFSLRSPLVPKEFGRRSRPTLELVSASGSGQKNNGTVGHRHAADVVVLVDVTEDIIAPSLTNCGRRGCSPLTPHPLARRSRRWSRARARCTSQVRRGGKPEKQERREAQKHHLQASAVSLQARLSYTHTHTVMSEHAHQKSGRSRRPCVRRKGICGVLFVTVEGQQNVVHFRDTVHARELVNGYSSLTSCWETLR